MTEQVKAAWEKVPIWTKTLTGLAAVVALLFFAFKSYSSIGLNKDSIKDAVEGLEEHAGPVHDKIAAANSVKHSEMVDEIKAVHVIQRDMAVEQAEQGTDIKWIRKTLEDLESP